MRWRRLALTRRWWRQKGDSVEVWQEAQKDPGSITFFAQVPEGDATAPAREAMLAVFERLKTEPITEAEVARVRAKAAKYFDSVISDPQKLGVAMSEAVALGDWRLFFIQRDRYRTVTAADVQRVALDYLKRANLTIGEFIPEAKPDRARFPRRSTSRPSSGTTRAIGSGHRRTFDTSRPISRRARSASRCPNGMKLALRRRRRAARRSVSR